MTTYHTHILYSHTLKNIGRKSINFYIMLNQRGIYYMVLAIVSIIIFDLNIRSTITIYYTGALWIMS